MTIAVGRIREHLTGPRVASGTHASKSVESGMPLGEWRFEFGTVNSGANRWKGIDSDWDEGSTEHSLYDDIPMAGLPSRDPARA